MLQAIFAVLCGAGVFLLANATRNRGWTISDQICFQAAALCDNPGSIAIVGVVLVIFAAIHMMVRT